MKNFWRDYKKIVVVNIVISPNVNEQKTSWLITNIRLLDFDLNSVKLVFFVKILIKFHVKTSLYQNELGTISLKFLMSKNVYLCVKNRNEQEKRIFRGFNIV